MGPATLQQLETNFGSSPSPVFQLERFKWTGLTSTRCQQGLSALVLSFERFLLGNVPALLSLKTPQAASTEPYGGMMDLQESMGHICKGSLSPGTICLLGGIC